MVEGLTVEDPSIKKDMPATSQGVDLRPKIAEYIDGQPHEVSGGVAKAPTEVVPQANSIAETDNQKEDIASCDFQIKPQSAEPYVLSKYYLIKVTALAYRSPNGAQGPTSILMTRSEYELLKDKSVWGFSKEELLDAPDIITNNHSSVSQDERFSYWTEGAKEVFPKDELRKIESAQRFAVRI